MLSISNVSRPSPCSTIPEVLLSEVLEFVGTPTVAQVSRQWNKLQQLVNERILKLCREEPLLRNHHVLYRYRYQSQLRQFYLGNAVPSMRVLQEYIIDFGGIVLLLTAMFGCKYEGVPLLWIQHMKRCAAEVSAIMDAIYQQFPGIASNLSIHNRTDCERSEVIKSFCWVLYNNYSRDVYRITALNLSSKNLTHISEILLRKFPNLIQLDLSHNQLTAVPLAPLRRRNGCRIDLSDNQIQDVPPEVWKDHIFSLDLRNNPLKTTLDPSDHQSERTALKIHALFALAIVVACVCFGLPWTAVLGLSVGPLLLHLLLHCRDRYLIERHMAHHDHRGSLS